MKDIMLSDSDTAIHVIDLARISWFTIQNGILTLRMDNGDQINLDQVEKALSVLEGYYPDLKQVRPKLARLAK